VEDNPAAEPIDAEQPETVPDDPKDE